jgi:autotransporter-associated beta strand protein
MTGGELICSNTWLHIGWDGIGIMTQSGGEINTASLIVDGNRSTLPFDNTTNTYTMTGGKIIIGSGGIRCNDYAVINLGGGIIESSAPWSCSKNITLTGDSGNATFSTLGGNITLSGKLSGAGGFSVDGNSTVTISATNTFAGAATVKSGRLEVEVSSSLGSSSNVTVDAGAELIINNSTTLATNAILNISGTAELAAGTSNTVSELYISGQAMVPGTWGSSSSPAGHKSSRFTGSGIVSVLEGPPPSGMLLIVH